ncbi:MAG: hypothetical protein K2J13_04415, partial [Clostridia bacterium]|nr:hypothetical protein [Clostridia bacterium]
MNSFTKRKITAVAVSLMLVVAIVVTGVLCAPNLHKSDVSVSALDLNINDYATYEYDAYDQANPYAVGRVEYTNKNTELIRITDSESSSVYTNVWYPTDIYLDVTETLQSAGYYIALDGRFVGIYKGGAGDKKNKIRYWQNLLGQYANDTVANRFDENARIFYDRFTNYGFKHFIDGTTNGITLDNNNSTGASAAANGTKNPSTNANTANSTYTFAVKNNNSKTDPRFTFALQGKFNTNKVDVNAKNAVTDFVYRTGTYTGADKASANVALYERQYDDWGNYQNGLATHFSQATDTSVNWIRYPLDSNSTYADGTYAEVTGIPVKKAADNILKIDTVNPDMEIRIHIYDKTELYKAMAKLQLSLNGLKGLPSNIDKAQELIDQAKDALGKREVTGEKVNKLINDMNDFEFEVVRPKASLDENYDSTTRTNYAWIFGDENRGGGNNYFLEGIWSNYNASVAQYLTVEIDRQIADEFNASNITRDTTKTITNADDYNNTSAADKGAYVRNAGSYT